MSRTLRIVHDRSAAIISVRSFAHPLTLKSTRSTFDILLAPPPPLPFCKRFRLRRRWRRNPRPPPTRPSPLLSHSHSKRQASRDLLGVRPRSLCCRRHNNNFMPFSILHTPPRSFPVTARDDDDVYYNLAQFSPLQPCDVCVRDTVLVTVATNYLYAG